MASRFFLPGWKVVFGSAVGISFGSAIFFASGFALFAAAWAKAFGWNQPELARAATLYLLLQIVAYPIYGWLLDRWGSRRVACISIFLFALSLLGLSRIGPSLPLFYLVFAFLALTAAATNVIAYARAISLWFQRRRGLAIGLATAAQAVGSACIPLVAERIIETAGWSSALVALGLFELIVCLPLVAWLVKDSPAPYGLHPDGDEDGGMLARAEPARAVSSRAILGSQTFWKLAICVAFEGFTLYALLPNVVFILHRTAHLAPHEIAKVLSISGLAFLLGRIGFGHLLDRMQARLVCPLMIVVAAAGVLIDALTGSLGWAIAAACLIGLAGGGETDLMPYVASRYFGALAVSKSFGYFLVAFFAGAAVGPIAFARFAGAHGVAGALLALAAIQVIPALLFLTLSPYPGRASEIGSDAETGRSADAAATAG